MKYENTLRALALTGSLLAACGGQENDTVMASEAVCMPDTEHPHYQELGAVSCEQLDFDMEDIFGSEKEIQVKVGAQTCSVAGVVNDTVPLNSESVIFVVC